MSYSAVTFAVVAMLSWGVWALLADVATRSLPPAVAMGISYAAGVLVAAGYVLRSGGGVSLTGDGVGVAVLAGVFAGVGAIAFYAGLERGSTGAVTTVSALYFVVAAALGVLVLGESVTWNKVAGVGFAVLAVLLLAR